MNEKIFEKAVCAVLTLEAFGGKRKVRNPVLNTNADEARLKIEKLLLSAPEIDAIRSADAQFRLWVTTRSLPSGFKGGVYLLPNALIESTYQRAKDYERQRQTLVEKAVEALPRMIEEARIALRDLFNEREFPSANEFRSAYRMRFRLVNFDTPVSLQGVRDEIWREEREKAAAAWTEALDECRNVLRAEMLDLCEHLTEKLGTREGGKPKIFRDSLVGNITDFLSTVDARNITDDAELKALTDKARALLNGVTPESLRKNEGLRDAVRGSFEDLREKVAALVVANKPSREYDFAD